MYDVKPYVPMYDSVQSGTGVDGVLNTYESIVRVPKWIEDTITTRNSVYLFSKDTDQDNNAIMLLITGRQHKLKHYKNNAELYMKGIKETLSVDIRSKYQTRKASGSVGVKRSEINSHSNANAKNTTGTQLGQDSTPIESDNRTTTIPFDNTFVTYTWDSLTDVINITDICF